MLLLYREKRKFLRAKRAKLASLKLPQDAYMGSKNTNEKGRPKEDAAEEGKASMETEEGEIEDDDLTLEPELEIQLD